MKKEKTVKAELWEINICGSAIDMVHGAYQTIQELYIPSKKISCNIANNYAHCFKTDKGRYFSKETSSKKIAMLDLPEKFVDFLEIQIKSQGAIKKSIESILEIIKK